MPGGPSGFETLERLHLLDERLPVIACSGYFQEDARELCQAIGFAEILAKPFSPDVLGSVMRRVLAGGHETAVTHGVVKDGAQSL
jgi:CheY-like chemotaxis protein